MLDDSVGTAYFSQMHCYETCLGCQCQSPGPCVARATSPLGSLVLASHHNTGGAKSYFQK